MGEASADRLRYEQWVRLYAQPLYRYAYRLTGDATAAEDLVQDSFAEAWRCIAKQREPDKARGWLFGILRYRFANWVRKRPRTVSLPEQFEAASDVPDPLHELGERELLQLGLMKLSVEQRQTLLMVFVEQLTCRQTATTLGIPIGTVLSRLDSARRALRGVLGMPKRGRRADQSSKVMP